MTALLELSFKLQLANDTKRAEAITNLALALLPEYSVSAGMSAAISEYPNTYLDHLQKLQVKIEELRTPNKKDQEAQKAMEDYRPQNPPTSIEQWVKNALHNASTLLGPTTSFKTLELHHLFSAASQPSFGKEIKDTLSKIALLLQDSSFKGNRKALLAFKHQLTEIQQQHTHLETKYPYGSFLYSLNFDLDTFPTVETIETEVRDQLKVHLSNDRKLYDFYTQNDPDQDTFEANLDQLLEHYNWDQFGDAAKKIKAYARTVITDLCSTEDEFELSNSETDDEEVTIYLRPTSPSTHSFQEKVGEALSSYFENDAENASNWKEHMRPDLKNLQLLAEFLAARSTTRTDELTTEGLHLAAKNFIANSPSDYGERGSEEYNFAIRIIVDLIRPKQQISDETTYETTGNRDGDGDGDGDGDRAPIGDSGFNSRNSNLGSQTSLLSEEPDSTLEPSASPLSASLAALSTDTGSKDSAVGPDSPTVGEQTQNSFLAAIRSFNSKELRHTAASAHLPVSPPINKGTTLLAMFSSLVKESPEDSLRQQFIQLQDQSQRELAGEVLTSFQADLDAHVTGSEPDTGLISQLATREGPLQLDEFIEDKDQAMSKINDATSLVKAYLSFRRTPPTP